MDIDVRAAQRLAIGSTSASSTASLCARQKRTKLVAA